MYYLWVVPSVSCNLFDSGGFEIFQELLKWEQRDKVSKCCWKKKWHQQTCLMQSFHNPFKIEKMQYPQSAVK